MAATLDSDLNEQAFLNLYNKESFADGKMFDPHVDYDANATRVAGASPPEPLAYRLPSEYQGDAGALIPPLSFCFSSCAHENDHMRLASIHRGFSSVTAS